MEALINLDEEIRQLTKATEKLKASRNEKSKTIGIKIKEGLPVEDIAREVKQIGEQIKKSEKEMEAFKDDFQSMLWDLPNLPHDLVPEGAGEEDNLEIRKEGALPDFDFEPRSHHEIGKECDWLDFERGVKLSGNKFVVLKDQGAFYSRHLIQFMLNSARERGYLEVAPPLMAKRSVFYGSGQLPKFEDDLYKIQDDDSFLIPTGEVPLVNLYADEILSEEQLPLKLTCLSSCFRKEAGAAGKETKGLIRLHQFEKVELVAVCKPDQSNQMLDEIVADAEVILKKLGLPYRIMLLCTGDMSGFSTSKTYDLEVWFPSLKKYVEISSCSNCTDFQARRAKIRYKASTGKNQLVHTLNGSALAVGRCLAAVMEHYQQADGSIAWPDMLK